MTGEGVESISLMLVAGEESGDAHAAALAEGLRARRGSGAPSSFAKARRC